MEEREHGRDTVVFLWIDDGSILENKVDIFVDKEDADTVDFLPIDDGSE